MVLPAACGRWSSDAASSRKDCARRAGRKGKASSPGGQATQGLGADASTPPSKGGHNGRPSERQEQTTKAAVAEAYKAASSRSYTSGTAGGLRGRQARPTARTPPHDASKGRKRTRAAKGSRQNGVTRPRTQGGGKRPNKALVRELHERRVEKREGLVSLGPAERPTGIHRKMLT